MEICMIWFCLGVVIVLIFRSEAPQYKSEEDKFKDPWNWTGFGG